MLIAKTYATNTVKFTNAIRNNLIFNKQMPSLYLNNNFDIHDNFKNSIYSIEHIFPRSYLKKKDCNDMHNIIKTINELNNQRSNYKYVGNKNDNDKNWIELKYDNYVNHKDRLFIPNNSSRGFISRSILYMTKEYDYNPNLIIDKDLLINWYYSFPPTKQEIYHNEFIKKFQNKNNEFISKYNKKSNNLTKFLDSI